jgi:2-hydroxychromene-2-carboxylate isomerase
VPAPDPDQPVFYYDLASAACYLAAESIMPALQVVPEWEPVLARGVETVPVDAAREEIERRAAELELQPLRWPAGWPAADPSQAALAATYAKRVGRAVAFSLAALRQEFAGGRDIGDQSTVLIAGAACEMHPTALLKGMSLRSTAQALQEANSRALRAGVRTLPAIEVRGELFEGLDCVAQAGGALGALR